MLSEASSGEPGSLAGVAEREQKSRRGAASEDGHLPSHWMGASSMWTAGGGPKSDVAPLTFGSDELGTRRKTIIGASRLMKGARWERPTNRSLRRVRQRCSGQRQEWWLGSRGRSGRHLE